MLSALTRRFVAKVILGLGLLLMLLGIASLLGTLEGASSVSVLGSFSFLCIGFFCAVGAIKLNKRSLYLFFAGLFIQIGFFLLFFVLNLIHVSLIKTWPLLSVFSGLALLPTGWHCYGDIRSRYVVPAVFFVILGAALLFFSLGLVSFSFKEFILRWWPLLIVLTGLVLVLMSLGTKK